MCVLRAIDLCMLLVALLSVPPSGCSSLSSTHWPPAPQAPPAPEVALAAAPPVIHQLPPYHINPRQKPTPSHAAVPPSYNLHPPLLVVLDHHRQPPLPLSPPRPPYVYHRLPTDGQSPPAPPMGSDQLPNLPQTPPSYQVHEPVPVPPTGHPRIHPSPPVHVFPTVEPPSHWPRHRPQSILPPPYKTIPEQRPPPYAYSWPSTHGRSPPPPPMDHAPLPRLPQTPPSYKAPPPLVHDPVPVPPTVYPKKPPQPPVHAVPIVEPPSHWPRHRQQPILPPPYKTISKQWPPLPPYAYPWPSIHGRSTPPPPPPPPMDHAPLPRLPQTPSSYKAPPPLVHEPVPVPVPPTIFPKKPPRRPVHVIPTVEPPSQWPRHRLQTVPPPPPYTTNTEHRPQQEPEYNLPPSPYF